MKAEDNAFPYLTFSDTATPAVPAAGDLRLFLDTADGVLKRIDSAAVVTAFGAAGAAGAAGTDGTNGTNGAGVPVGGTAGQVLSKIDGTDNNTQWIAPNVLLLPLANAVPGGTPTGTIIVRKTV